MKLELHEFISHKMCTLPWSNEHNIIISFYKYVTSSLNYFKSNTVHNDWYIIPLVLLIQKEYDRKFIFELSMKNTILSMTCSPLFYVVNDSGTKHK